MSSEVICNEQHTHLQISRSLSICRSSPSKLPSPLPLHSIDDSFEALHLTYTSLEKFSTSTFKEGFKCSTPCKEGGVFIPMDDSMSTVGAVDPEFSPYKDANLSDIDIESKHPLISTKDPSTSEVIELSSMSPSSILPKYWVKNLGLKVSDKEELYSGEWLSDMHINAAQRCLRDQYPQKNGLQNTLMLNHKQIYNSGQCNLVQIVNVSDQHWVCLSTSSKQPGVIDMYDSMPSCSKNSPSLKMQACAILKTSARSIRLNHIDVQRQNGGSDCGPFAIAFAKTLCMNEDPHSHKYNQAALRAHLGKCLERNMIDPFPSEVRRSRKQRVIHEQDVIVYCICRLPWDKFDEIRGPMVCCARCKEWYHQMCVGIQSSILSDPSAQYTCHACSS